MVDKIDGVRIVVKVTDVTDLSQSAVDIYNSSKFQRSNQNTCINQKPLVKVEIKLKKEILLQTGQLQNLRISAWENVTVAFMPWQGYNFEDSILISENALDTLRRYTLRNMSQWLETLSLELRRLLEIFPMSVRKA